MSSSPKETRVIMESAESVPLIDKRPDVSNQTHQNNPAVNHAEDVETHLQTRDLKKLEAFLKTPGDHNGEIRNKQLLHQAIRGKKDDYKFMTALLSVVNDETLFEVDSEGRTALHIAVQNERYGCCNAILMKNSEALSRGDPDGNTPLHYVVKRERNDMCKTFVKQCTEEIINLPNKDSLTPVHLAAQERNPEIMKLLLEYRGNPRAVTDEKFTPLHFAAKSGSYKCIQLLLAAVPVEDVIDYMNMPTNEGMTALMFAARQNLRPICQVLIQTDVSLKSREKKTVLHYAAERNSIKLVKLIVESILEANASDERKKEKMPFHDQKFTFSCLKASIKGKSNECFNYFLEKANEVTLSPRYVRKLVDSAVSLSLRCIQSMCRRQEFHDYLVNYRGEQDNNLLHLAVITRSYGTAKALIVDLHFDKVVRNKNGDSPLHLLAGQSCKAYRESHDENWSYVLQELALASHELVNATNDNGETPLILASGSGNIEIIKAFLRKEPDFFKANKRGKTAFHSAAENGRTDCLKLLLQSLKPDNLEQLRNQQKFYPLHLASAKGHAECCKLLLSDDLVGKNALQNLWLKDGSNQNSVDKASKGKHAGSGQYAVDKAFKGKHAEIFRDLLSKMEYDDKEKEFPIRLHGYFKKSLQCLSKDLSTSCTQFYEAVLDAVIESSWCKVAFDGRFCTQVHPQLRGTAPKGVQDVSGEPCSSFALLIEMYPNLGCRAMDKHITQYDDTQELEMHDYTPFEFIYYAREDGEPVTPFVPQPSSEQNKNNLSGQNPSSSAHAEEVTLRDDAKEFDGVSWYEHHPLQKAVENRHVEVLGHKLTQSWLYKKLEYTRWVLYPYFCLDVITAVVAAVLQSLFWNDHHLRVRFSGTTRRDVAVVYDSDFSYNSTVRAFVAAVDLVAVSDSHCATWGTGSYHSDPELLEPGSAAWNRSVCTIYHLEQSSALVISMEVLQVLLILLHVIVEYFASYKKPKVFSDLHRISRIYVRIPSMVFLLICYRPCDFTLGCRQIVIWQVDVVAVLLIWVHVVLMLNKMPRFSGFMPVTPKLLGRYALAILPLLVFLFAFSLAFHFLLMDNSAFATVPYSLMKTLTLMLGDLGYDDIFVNDEYPAAYPLLSNILFVIFIIGVGGLLLSFVVRNPQEQLSQLGDEDELNRAIVHLHLHLFIDECVPKRRRPHACARALSQKKLPSHFCVSSSKFKPNDNTENKENLESENISREIAVIKKDIKTILESLALSGAADDALRQSTPSEDKLK